MPYGIHVRVSHTAALENDNLTVSDELISSSKKLPDRAVDDVAFDKSDPKKGH